MPLRSKRPLAPRTYRRRLVSPTLLNVLPFGLRSLAHSRSVVCLICLAALGALPLAAQKTGEQQSNARHDVPETSEQSDASFADVIEPVLQAYCVDCHGPTDPDGALDLTAFDAGTPIESHFAVWDLIRQRVADGEMPPEDSGYELEPEEKTQFLMWLGQRRDDFIRRHAGDPGEVLAHRLSAAEYNYTIADLTGVNLRPADSFPVDPSNTAGFDNSGESLMMTPSLMSKYIDAARMVTDHLLFLPDGLAFAPHPVVTDTDRDKYCVRQIVDFYESQNTEVADYLMALRSLFEDFDRRSGSEVIGDRDVTAIAKRYGLSAKYLTQLWTAIGIEEKHPAGPLAQIANRIRSLPGDDLGPGAKQLADDIAKLRDSLTFEFPHLQVSGINKGSQPLVLWRNRQKASHRMTMNPEAYDRLRAKRFSEIALVAGAGKVEETAEEDTASGQSSKTLRRDFETFCRLFPDRYYVDRRGREYVNRKPNDFNRESEYRLLSAGFHSMMGYFRDDQPLRELVLDASQQDKLDRLWFQLNFVADVPSRQHSGFIWFERAEGRYLVDSEFDAFRSADRQATSPEMIEALAEVYIAKAERIGAGDEALDAMRFHFDETKRKVLSVTDAKAAAVEAQKRHLLRLVQRAFRRPLQSAERQDIQQFYQHLVEVDGLSHEDAVRDVVVSVLISPHFCYRAHPPRQVGDLVRLDGYELASRLSYFLWASLPDRRLLDLAAAGTLTDPAVLRSESKRMLRDAKAERLAIEFGGNWLGFRQFESHTGVDRQRFSQFDDQLQRSMFEEPITFFADLLKRDGQVLDFLYADHTFVDATLAKHYGIDQAIDANRWVRVDNASRFGRGGILPMSVFLTKNSPGLRTSPVKRGFWVVRQLLGTHIPAPPPNVPELPEDESKLGELTLREVLAKHREHKSCSGCHEKFDSVGLVFEGYGPIGERRDTDLAGNPVDVIADFPDGSKHSGVDGLKDYIRSERQGEFVDNLCRKLLAYALGRSLIVSDEPLIESMKHRLQEQQFAFSTMVETIVTSEQFLFRRGH
ncbi:DUF1592 domain-containing protein [Roseiconus lacunae]|uniref:DUF1592 domain-containing protein n=1 Tax=Roseiconus lacunae TaxID=2605694 RepID=UPI0011F1FF2B|nr:DUF1592 domain-containing protein [Roseiconus lacunae]